MSFFTYCILQILVVLLFVPILFWDIFANEE